MSLCQKEVLNLPYLKEEMERFWLEEPLSLLKSSNIIPQCGTSVATRLNALTRLVILITLLLYFLCFGQWWLFFLLGLLLILVLYYMEPQPVPVVENYTCYRPPSYKKRIENRWKKRDIPSRVSYRNGFKAYLP